MPTSDPHPHVTVFITIWAVIGPVIGLFVGAFLQSRQQQKQWKRDHRIEECRELLNAITLSYVHLADLKAGLRQEGVNIAALYNDSVGELHRILGSRLLVAREINDASVSTKWTDAMEQYQRDGNITQFATDYATIRDSIVAIGLKGL